MTMTPQQKRMKRPELSNAAREAIYRQMGVKLLSVQQKKVLETPHRRVIVSGGERGGKSFITSMMMGVEIVRQLKYGGHERGGAAPGDSFWIVANSYQDTKSEYIYLTEWMKRLGLYHRGQRKWDPGYIELTQCPECQVHHEKCGHPPVTIVTKTALVAETLVGDVPNMVVLCEGSKLSEDAFWRLRNRTMERRARLVANGTFDYASGWFAELWKKYDYRNGDTEIRKKDNMIAYNLPSYSNPHVYPEGINDPEIKDARRFMDPDQFRNRIEGIPSTPDHYVFPRFSRERQVSEEVEFDPALGSVFVAVDPGFSAESAYAVVCFQVKQAHEAVQVRVFDEIYKQLEYGEQVVDAVMQRHWWNRTHKIGIGDVAARQHQMGPSQAEMWAQRAGLVLNGEKVGIMDGINQLRSLMRDNDETGEPSMVVNPRCHGLLSELGVEVNPHTRKMQVYEWKRRDRGHVRADAQKPRDAYNHSVKALIYGVRYVLGDYGIKGLRKPSVFDPTEVH